MKAKSSGRMLTEISRHATYMDRSTAQYSRHKSAIPKLPEKDHSSRWDVAMEPMEHAGTICDRSRKGAHGQE